MSTNRKNHGIHIRDARSGELDNVSQFLKSAYQQYRKLMPSAIWQSYLEDILDVHSRLKDAQLIVAEMSGRLVGTVTLYLSSTGYSEGGWPEGWAGIRLLGVDPEYRGRGIGRALMDECVRRCNELGIKTIGLHTTELMDVAREMYERMGFTRIPEMDFHPRPGVTVMTYKLSL